MTIYIISLWNFVVQTNLLSAENITTVLCRVIFLYQIIHSGIYNHFRLCFPEILGRKQDITHIISDETKVEGGCEYFMLKRRRKKYPLICCF